MTEPLPDSAILKRAKIEDLISNLLWLFLCFCFFGGLAIGIIGPTSLKSFGRVLLVQISPIALLACLAWFWLSSTRRFQAFYARYAAIKLKQTKDAFSAIDCVVHGRKWSGQGSSIIQEISPDKLLCKTAKGSWFFFRDTKAIEPIDEARAKEILLSKDLALYENHFGKVEEA